MEKDGGGILGENAGIGGVGKLTISLVTTHRMSGSRDLHILF